MGDQNKRILEQDVSYVGEILQDIYHRLPTGPVTEESLAKVLSAYFPSESEENLIRYCKMLRNGIQKGREDFEKMYDLSEEQQTGEIAAALESGLSGISGEEQHQRLVLLYQILCHQYGRKVDGNLAVYLANLSDDRLKQDISFLLEQEGECTINEMLSALGKENEKYSLPEEASSHLDEDNSWIMSAAIYTAARQRGYKIAEPVGVGKQVGFVRTFLSRLAEVALTKVLPVGLAVLATAATGVAIGVLIWYLGGVLTSSGIATTVFDMLRQSYPYHFRMLLGGILAAPFVAASNVGGWVYAQFLQMMDQPRVEMAENALETHFRTIQELADEAASVLMISESEDENGEAEEEEIRVEDGVVFA